MNAEDLNLIDASAVQPAYFQSQGTWADDDSAIAAAGQETSRLMQGEAARDMLGEAGGALNSVADAILSPTAESNRIEGHDGDVPRLDDVFQSVDWHRAHGDVENRFDLVDP